MMSGIGPRISGFVLVCIAAAAGSLAVPAASIADPLPADPASGWQWRLTGVVIGPGLSEALFTHAGETRTAKEGQQIDGWTVAAIRPHGVTLKNAGAEKNLSPEGFSPEEAAAAARALAEQAAQADAIVSAASLQQQRDQQVAEAVLIEATKQMTTR